MAKKPTLILPVGVAVFPHLNEVDVYQPTDDKGRPSGAEKRQYITYVRYEPAVLEQVQKQLKEAAAAAGAKKGAKMPFKELKIKDSDETEIVLKVASGEKYRPAGFDARNNKLPVDVIIGGGSKIRCDVTVNYYSGFGGGVNLYLNAYQVIELVEGGTSKSRFDEAEGFAFEGKANSGASEDHNAGDGKDAFAF